MFSTEQIEAMMNEGIKGHKQPFSIAHLITQKKIQDLLNESPKEKRGEADRPVGTRERNSFLRIIAALAVELKVPLANPSKAGAVIAAMTDRLGESVDHSTIELKIKEIQKLIKILPKTSLLKIPN